MRIYLVVPRESTVPRHIVACEDIGRVLARIPGEAFVLGLADPAVPPGLVCECGELSSILLHNLQAQRRSQAGDGNI
jgi:hypothetical protein